MNVIAPEHLELHCRQARSNMLGAHHATRGAIFVGEWTPEAVGDYVAGPNHTLPTGGTARYASSAVRRRVRQAVVQRHPVHPRSRSRPTPTPSSPIARHEGLWAHARMSVELRCNELAGGDRPTVDAGLDGADE